MNQIKKLYVINFKNNNISTPKKFGFNFGKNTNRAVKILINFNTIINIISIKFAQQLKMKNYKLKNFLLIQYHHDFCKTINENLHKIVEN